MSKRLKVKEAVAFWAITSGEKKRMADLANRINWGREISQGRKVSLVSHYNNGADCPHGIAMQISQITGFPLDYLFGKSEPITIKQ